MTTTIALATSRTSTDEHDPNNVAFEVAAVVLDAPCPHCVEGRPDECQVDTVDGDYAPACCRFPKACSPRCGPCDGSGRVSGDEYVWRIKPQSPPSDIKAVERYGWLYRVEDKPETWTWNSVDLPGGTTTRLLPGYTPPAVWGASGLRSTAAFEATSDMVDLFAAVAHRDDVQPLRVVGDRAWQDVAALRRLADLHGVEWPDGLVLDTAPEDDVRSMLWAWADSIDWINPPRTATNVNLARTLAGEHRDRPHYPPDDLASAKDRVGWYTAIYEACR